MPLSNLSPDWNSGVPPRCEPVRHGGALPALPHHRVNLYVAPGPRASLAEGLAALLRQSYGVADSLAAE